MVRLTVNILLLNVLLLGGCMVYSDKKAPFVQQDALIPVNSQHAPADEQKKKKSSE